MSRLVLGSDNEPDFCVDEIGSVSSDSSDNGQDDDVKDAPDVTPEAVQVPIVSPAELR